MDQFKRFMYGRYGLDQFTRALVILSIILTVLSSFTNFLPIYALSYMLLGYALFRVFSRNYQKRSRENQIYLERTSRLRKSLNEWKTLLIGTSTHKYYKCSRCHQTIRVPRGRGKISITCPKCKNEFIRKT